MAPGSSTGQTEQLQSSPASCCYHCSRPGRRTQDYPEGAFRGAMVHNRSLPAFSPLDQRAGSHCDPKGHFLLLLQLNVVTQPTGWGRATSNTQEGAALATPESLESLPCIPASLLVLSSKALPSIIAAFCKLGSKHMTCFYCPKAKAASAHQRSLCAGLSSASQAHAQHTAATQQLGIW